MIQELLGGVMEERKISIPGGLLLHSSSASSPTSSLSSQSQSAASSSPSPAPAEPQQNLRCPRCDSSNTKFCYYNNYNLTQPRHFCKTCRRYWTKGGALRNVPIGGGCRKTKAMPSITSAASIGSKSATKTKGPASADFLARSDLAGGLDHELPVSPILWASPHTSHLMAFLRAASVQNPKPNPNSSSTCNFNAHMMAEPAVLLNNAHGLSLDPSIHDQASLWRNSNHSSYQQHPPQPQSQQHQHNNILLGHEMSSLGFQDLYQRFKLSTDHYHINDQLQTVVSNSVGSLDPSSCSSAIAMTSAAVAVPASMDASSRSSVMEPIPLSVGELGYWNPNQALSWADLPAAANGAFH